MASVQEKPSFTSQANLPRGRTVLSTAAAFLANFVSAGLVLSYAVFLQLYLSDDGPKDLSPFKAAWIGSLQLLCLHAGAVIPETYFHAPAPVMTVGAVMCLASQIWASFNTSYGVMLFSEGILFGLGASLVYHPPMRLLRRCHSTAKIELLPIAIASSGALFGAIFWSILVQVVSRLVGLDWTHRGIAVTSIFFLVICTALTSTLAGDMQRENPASADAVAAAPISSRSVGWDVAALASLFCLYAGLSVPAVFVASFAADLDGEPTTAAYAQMGFYAAGLVGHTVTAVLERQVSRKYILLAAAAVSGLTSAAFPVVISTPIIILYFALLGCLVGAVLARSPDHYVQAMMSAKHVHAGNAVALLGLLLGGPICGAVADMAGGGWMGGSFVCTGGLLVGSIVLAVVFGWELRR